MQQFSSFMQQPRHFVELSAIPVMQDLPAFTMQSAVLEMPLKQALPAVIMHSEANKQHFLMPLKQALPALEIQSADFMQVVIALLEHPLQHEETPLLICSRIPGFCGTVPIEYYF